MSGPKPIKHPAWRRILRSIGISALLIILCAIAIAIHFITGGFWSKEEREISKKLMSLVPLNITEISVASLTSFRWSRVCAIGHIPPGRESLNEVLGFEWKEYVRLDRQFPLDAYWTFLFVQDDQKVIPVRIDRGAIGDLNDKEDVDIPCVPHGSATLFVTKYVDKSIPPNFSLKRRDSSSGESQ